MNNQEHVSFRGLGAVSCELINLMGHVFTAVLFVNKEGRSTSRDAMADIVETHLCFQDSSGERSLLSIRGGKLSSVSVRCRDDFIDANNLESFEFAGGFAIGSVDFRAIKPRDGITSVLLRLSDYNSSNVLRVFFDLQDPAALTCVVRHESPRDQAFIVRTEHRADAGYDQKPHCERDYCRSQPVKPDGFWRRLLRLN